MTSSRIPKHRLPLATERVVREAEAYRQLATGRFEAGIHIQAADSKGTVTCQKGCHHCCHYPVSLSILEGISLFRWLTDHNLWRRQLKQEFEDMHTRVWGLVPSVWFLSMIPCPLLTKEGLCSAYEGRPFVCRTTVSFNDPHLCHPHRFEGAPGIISRRGISEEVGLAESAMLRAAKLPLVRLPLSTAVLVGERICKDELDPEDVNDHLLEEWTRHG